MANVRTLKLNLLGDVSSFNKSMKTASKNTNSFSQDVARNMKIATAAVGGLAIAFGVSAVKAAIEDQKSQKQLQIALKNTTKATDKQLSKVEDWITAQGRLLGVTDDELRPALAKLVRVTGDVNKSQDLLTLAMDIAAGTGKSLETVTGAITRAQQGNLAGLKKLGIPLSDTIIKNKDLAEALKIANQRFNGAAKAAGDTMAGKLKKFKTAMDESKESIGGAILQGLQPFAEKWLPKVTTGVQHFIDGLTGQNNAGGLNGAFKDNQASVYKLGHEITIFFKTLKDNEELLKRIATVIGAIFIGAKATAAASAMGAAVKTLIPAFKAVTVAAGTTAAAEAAATGGASLAVAAPAILGIATALGLGSLVALYTWKGKPKDYKKDFDKAKEKGSGVSVAKSTAEDLARINSSSGFEGPAGTTKVVGNQTYYWDAANGVWYTADISGNKTYLPKAGNPGPSNFKAKRSSFGGGDTTIVNLNGIVDGESARRNIERLLQQSSIRTGAVNVNGALL